MTVFLSYQREDRRAAETLRASLVLAGLDVFMDCAIRVGDKWDLALEEALFSSSSVVVCWTGHSVKSRWVRLEARYGLNQGILCPVRLEPCTLPIEFSDIQTAELHSPSDWTISNPEFARLIEGVLSLSQLKRPPALAQDAMVFFRLAEKYAFGDGAPQNRALAEEWCRKADQCGHPAAQALLAELLEQR